MNLTSDGEELYSPVLTLHDDFCYNVSKLDSLIPLGSAPNGKYHIAIFFKQGSCPRYTFNLDTTIQINSNINIIPIHSNSVNIGYLFSVTEIYLTLNKTSFSISTGNFSHISQIQYTKDKNGVYLYRDGSDNVFVNVLSLDSNFLVLDE